MTRVLGLGQILPQPTPRGQLGQGRQGAGGDITEGAQGSQQHGQEHVDPLMDFALEHAKQASLHHLECGGLEVGQEEEQAFSGIGNGQCL